MARNHKHILTMRLTPAQHRTLVQLSKKLNLDKTSVLRFALARLAESEKLIGGITGGDGDNNRHNRGERP